MSDKHYPFIDGLRAVAVLPVLFFHFNLPYFTGGYVGVDVFFVISGFLITGLIFGQMEKGRFSLLHFYERRARRILPALFATCLLCVIGAWVLFVPKDFETFSKSLKGVAVFASNFIFARSVGYFADPVSVKPLLHTWSLAVEEQFYLIFPLILFALSRMSGKAVHAGIYGLFVLSLVLSEVFVASSPERTFYLLHTRAWELLAGAILALHARKARLRASTAEIMSAAGMIGLAASFVFYDRDTVFPGVAAVLPVLSTVFVLWANLKNETAVGRGLSSRPFVAIGLISYGLYLYHWPVLVFARYYLDRDLGPMDSLVAFPIIAALATASYIFLEKPVRSGAWLKSRAAVFRLSAAGILLFGLFAVAGVQAKGFPARFDAAALQYAEGARDLNGAWAKCIPLPQNLSEETVCTVGTAKKSAPDFLLWGDSHANALQPAVAAWAEKKGLKGWVVTYAGCPSLWGVERSDGYVEFSCRAIAEKVFSMIRENKIKHVLIASRWDMYALGWEEGGLETTRRPKIAYQALSGQDALAASLKETARRLREMGVNFWVVKQVPPQLVHVPSALAKAAHLGRDAGKMRRSYDAIVARRAAIDPAFAGMPSIDPLAMFCPEKSMCVIEHDGRALYSDDTHLSTTGALWSREMLRPFFQSF